MFSQHIALDSMISFFLPTISLLATPPLDPFGCTSEEEVFAAVVVDDDDDRSNDAFTTFVSSSVPKPHINLSPAVGMSCSLLYISG